MFKSIAWATDGSESADLALPYAKGLAAEHDAKLHVVHCVEHVLGPRAGGQPVHADEDELKAKIKRQVAELSDEGIDANEKIVSGSSVTGAAHMIADAAREANGDVIIVGTRGHTPLAGLLVGGAHTAPAPHRLLPGAGSPGRFARHGRRGRECDERSRAGCRLLIGFRRRRRMQTDVVDRAPHHGGWVAPGFEEVRAEFDRNFVERGEIGAAVAAYWRGEKVVDLWGGRRTPTGDAPWNEDTMVVVNSTTKGLAAMTVAVANSRGWIDYDAPVAEYWPEFAQNGKGAITVRQLLGHEAGLVLYRRAAARSRTCATSTMSLGCSRGRSRRGNRERDTATTR